MASKPTRVLGVDTSLRSTGVGVVQAGKGSFKAIHYGTIKNPSRASHSSCLENIHRGIVEVIEKTNPTEVAVEGIFHCKNVRTAVVLGEARGVVLAACSAAGLSVYEYSPRRVKQAVVGVGSAHKDQVGRMIMSMLGLEEQPASDAADALAIAICHCHSRTGYEAIAPKEI